MLWRRTRPTARPDEPDPRIVSTRRGLVLGGLQLGVGALLVWRLRELQVLEAEHYRLLAEENRINMQLIAPVRAQLFDRSGRPLAVNTRNYRVVMIREQVGDVEAMLNRLGQLIEIPEHQRRRILKEVHQKSAFVPVGVAEHLSWKDFAQVNANAPALPGIEPEVGLTRHYPYGRETAHVIGYVGRVSQADLDRQRESSGTSDPVLQIPEFQIGKTGIERALDTGLRGTAGTRRIEVNAVGRVIRELDRIDGVGGADLHLTLDLELQRYCIERLGEESAAAVLLGVEAGDVLAAASTPTYDPNPFVLGISQADFDILRNNDHRPLHNKWASGMYPPGSTFKMIVGLAALEAGVIDQSTSHYCPGYLELGRRRFHCWRRGGHGSVALRKALGQSCDVYFYEVARAVGIDRIADMAHRFGLGEDLDLPVAELRSGLIPSKVWKRRQHEEEWMVGDTFNAGIGQGYVLATPLQLALMTARIAAGRGVRPRLVRARSGRPVPVQAPVDLGISNAHLALIRTGMADVVNGARGTARGSIIDDPEFRMAGKTGTSQVRNITAAERASGVVNNRDLPWNRRDHALFVGYAPAEQPRFAVAVVVEHGGGGAATAAPIARDILLKARELFAPDAGVAPRQGRRGPKRSPVVPT